MDRMTNSGNEKRTRPRIMIVDNNALIRDLIRESLQPLTSDVLECVSGEEALVRYDHYLPDWVTMDVIMDGIDGLETAQRIKSNHPEATILMITLCDHPRLRQEALEAGCVAVLSKKKISDVRTIIEAALSASKTNRA
jgi:two-component system, chemotaxis family, chemotaxis protein CheY